MFYFVVFICQCDIRRFSIDFFEISYWFMWFSCTSTVYTLSSIETIDFSRVNHSMTKRNSSTNDFILVVQSIQLWFTFQRLPLRCQSFIFPFISIISSKNLFHLKFNVGLFNTTMNQRNFNRISIAHLRMKRIHSGKISIRNEIFPWHCSGR